MAESAYQQVTVVLADDSPLFRRGIERALERRGDIKIVALADDGAQALESIVAHEPDVAVLDMQMPHMSGIDVCERITHDHPALRTKVVLMSSAMDGEAESRAYAAGVTVCMNKLEASRRSICDAAASAARSPLVGAA